MTPLPDSRSALLRHVPAACFVAGMCGVFTLAGAGSGQLDVSVLLPLVLAALSLFLTRADQHFAGPPVLLQAFALCGLLQMPLLPLLASEGRQGLVVDGLLPGVLRVLLVGLFCLVAMLSRKRSPGGAA